MPEPPRRPPLGSWLPGPEIVAGVAAVLIVALIGGSAFASPPTPPTEGVRPTPGPVATAVVTPAPRVNAAAVLALRATNSKILEFGQMLSEELDRDVFRTSAVVSLIRRLNAYLKFAQDNVALLGGESGEGEVGGRLAAVYLSLRQTAEDTLKVSNTNQAEYQAGAGALVELMAELPALQAELEALLVAPTPSPSPIPTPTPVATPSAVATPSPTAVATPTPPPTARPTPSGPPGPSPRPGEQIDDGGFEGDIAASWELRLASGAAATIQADTTTPGQGAQSARIDIASGTDAYSGVTLRQSGVAIEAGVTYALTIRVRAASPRDLRIRIAAADGAPYWARSASVSAEWTTITWQFPLPNRDAAAALEIDVGQSAITTWFDAISLAPLPTPSP